MSTLAYSILPWRRWWRHARKRLGRRPGAVAKPWNAIIGVSALIALDQISKNFLVTQGGEGGHVSNGLWLAYALGLSVLLAALSLIRLIRVPALLACAGATGNALSDLLHGAVNNPFQMQYESYLIAFNAADVYLVSGAAAAIVILATRRQPTCTP